MYKKIDDLELAEIKKVFNNNKNLQQEVIKSYISVNLEWVNRILDLFENSIKDWQIDFYTINYIAIKDKIEFLQALINAKNQFEVLSDNKNFNIDHVNIIIRKLSEDKKEKWIDEATEDYKNMLLDYFNKYTEYSRYDLFNHFLEFYSVHNLPGNHFIDDNYILTYK